MDINRYSTSPKKIIDFFDDEFDYRFISNAQELTDMAVSIFVGLLAAQDVNVGSYGGGSQSDLPWRDKDEDVIRVPTRVLYISVIYLCLPLLFFHLHCSC